MGIHGDFGNERVAEAYRAMIAAARKHGKFPGMAGVYNETIMPRYIEMGARFILSGQDAAFMAAGAPGFCGSFRRASAPSQKWLRNLAEEGRAILRCLPGEGRYPSQP